MTSTNNILLVEENADDRDLTIMVLKDSKIANEIDIAGDGEEALRYFEDQSRPLLNRRSVRIVDHRSMRRAASPREAPREEG